jgi:hypothetical protein
MLLALLMPAGVIDIICDELAPPTDELLANMALTVWDLVWTMGVWVVVELPEFELFNAFISDDKELLLLLLPPLLVDAVFAAPLPPIVCTLMAVFET